jgi:hypothetical protein
LVVAGEDLHVDDDAADARRARCSEVSFTSPAFSPKMARSSFSSGASSVSPFGRDLADQDVAGLHLGADADDAAVVEVA